MFILMRTFLSYFYCFYYLCVWDEVGLLSDISWAVMHNRCQHLQSERHQKGSNVSPHPMLPRLNICAQVWRCALWGHLLQFVPFGKLWARAETAGCLPSPSLPTGSWKVGREPDPKSQPAAGVHWPRPLVLNWHLKGSNSRFFVGSKELLTRTGRVHH